MEEVIHNLPSQPYSRFFGRQNTIDSIIENLIEGSTYIVSIDGVGGIGKTALAYYFCREYLLKEGKFKYIVWLTAKETVFDPFSKEKLIKQVKNDFKGVKTLVDATLETLRCDEILKEPFEIKKEFFEDIIVNNPIFFVLDNLENIYDNEFFDYITRTFNKIANKNRMLKVLTTSRKKKKIVDFPIEIEGLTTEDALLMLKYLAKKQNIKEILNQKSDHDNIKLIEKVARIPLGIEFIIGQLALGRNRGQIFEELDGYPSLEQAKTHQEKKKLLSDIILFSFKDMYETLTEDQQFLFMVVSALQRNKKKDDIDISFELLLSITKFNTQRLSDAIDTLISHKLISIKGENNYFATQMAINFTRQFYADFEKIEDKVVGMRNDISSGKGKGIDSVDIILEGVRKLTENYEYSQAEAELKDILEKYQDYRLYFQLAKIQRNINNFVQAGDNFRMASELNPKDHRIWFDWVSMEQSRNRHNIALEINRTGLKNTDYEISLALMLIEHLYLRGDIEQMRKAAKEFHDKYIQQARKNELSKLLEKWLYNELQINKKDNIDLKNLFEVMDYKLKSDVTFEEQLEIFNAKFQAIEEYKGTKTLELRNEKDKLRDKISSTERSIYRSISTKVKYLNITVTKKDYVQALKMAKDILYWSLTDKDPGHIPCYQVALRQFLQILSRDHLYQEVIKYYEEYISFGKYDEPCVNVYNKANKETCKINKTEIIKDILNKITECEDNLRKIVLFSIDNDEDRLVSLVINRGYQEWIEQWESTKKKALSKNVSLIFYSDLSQLKGVFKWIKPEMVNKDKPNESTILKLASEILKSIEHHFNIERNESFHSRLPLLEEEELTEVKVDIHRISKNIIKLKSILSTDFLETN